MYPKPSDTFPPHAIEKMQLSQLQLRVAETILAALSQPCQTEREMDEAIWKVAGRVIALVQRG